MPHKTRTASSRFLNRSAVQGMAFRACSTCSALGASREGSPMSLRLPGCPIEESLPTLHPREPKFEPAFVLPWRVVHAERVLAAVATAPRCRPKDQLGLQFDVFDRGP